SVLSRIQVRLIVRPQDIHALLLCRRYEVFDQSIVILEINPEITLHLFHSHSHRNHPLKTEAAGTSHRLIVTSAYDQALVFIFRSWIPSGRITLPSTRSVA